MTQLHHIRLELAREARYPEGSSDEGYDLVAPLDSEGRLDGDALRAAPDSARVRRFSRNETVSSGHLRHGPGGRWVLAMDQDEAGDAVGFRFGDERFVAGEYVSLSLPSGGQHTYVVARVAEV